jgi:SpoVK/Ycf46/Vps4 family AAA+-type ATPase
MRRVLQIVENISPCILFIDEIEKGFAGMQSSTFSDSGVTARVIGSFLIWMQECKAPVFTVATSNAIHYLPPELIGRFDECFFVNMPQVDEREVIFSIHIKKLGKDPEKFDLKKLAEKSQDLSGREIEQVLKESMYDAFHEKSDLTTEVILRALSKKTSLLTTMGEQMSYLLKWVGWDPQKKDGVRARFASPVDEMNRSRVMSEIDAMLKEVGSKPIDPAGIGLDGSGPSKC